ncbi:MAG: BatD family protein [Verrucomicrobia bacterium]|nr:BatD family protein [Verrucomicrobiota bacterium]
MVKGYVVLLFILIATTLQAADLNVNLPAKVSVEIPPNSALANQPIPCFITIIRLAWQKVDESSFRLGDEPLKAVFIDNQYPSAVRDSQSLVVSRYRFTLAPTGPGLYTLPTVSVRVGGDLATAVSYSYRVISPEHSDELKLAAGVAEKGPIYPGQKINLQYRISFRKPIELVREELPLLRLQGFRNVGAPQIGDILEGAYTTQVISQAVVAPDPGDYHTGQSLIQGYIYAQDALGNKSYISPLLEAVVPDTVITVSPFPVAGKPLSFNGAIGVFYWRVKLLGSSSVTAGQRMQLEILVTGSGDLDSVHLPDLTLQDDFKDNFRFSDLAPVGQIENGTKKFIVELRPVSQAVKQISGIQFSSFDPISKTYVVRKSDPIPITVKPGSVQEQQENPVSVQPQNTTQEVSPIEIQGNRMLEENDLRTWHLEGILVVYAICVLAGLLAIEVIVKRLAFAARKKEQASYSLFLEAIKQKGDPEASSRLLEQALLLKLYEVGLTKEIATHPQELTSDGLQGEVRKFLISIEEKRFTGLGTQVEIKDIIDEASQLYYQLKQIQRVV